MSQVKMETIWQHDKVLPYILENLKEKIEAITPVRKIVLYGSRARTPLKDWEKLEGKDWDVIVVCDFPIMNTYIWTKDFGYHIDLTVTTKDRIDHFERYNMTYLELFPNNELEIAKMKKNGN